MSDHLIKREQSIKASKTDDGHHLTVTGFSNSDELQKAMFGVSGNETFNKLLHQLTTTSSGEHAVNLNALSPLLLDIKPQDALEGMLAVQMIATHNMAIEMSHRAIDHEKSSEVSEMFINKAAKLMRLFTAQVDTLQKKRNKGNQTIQVQHVNVEAGGQAVVGNMNNGRG